MSEAVEAGFDEVQSGRSENPSQKLRGTLSVWLARSYSTPRKVSLTFSPLKFVGKVGQMNCRRDFYDERGSVLR